MGKSEHSRSNNERGAIIPAVAKRINEAHRAALTSAKKAFATGIERAIEVGRLLAEEKTRHGHGEWIPWIAKNLEFNRFQAAGYLRAYENRERLSNVQAPNTFGLQGALKLLAKPREKAPPTPRGPLPASVEVVDSDEDYVDDNPDFGKDEARADPAAQIAAFLIRGDQAARFAFYSGPISEREIAMARRVVEAWTKLLNELEDSQ